MATLQQSNEVADVLEERLIDAEYKIWKKNTPYLYDFVMTHSLEWPSLTCQWLPNVRNAGIPNATEHSLLLGTHTTGEQNYIMVASCCLPSDEVPGDQKENSDSQNKEKGKSNAKATVAARYDEEKKEMGGFGHASSNIGKIEIRMKVKHEGEVNRARYMPQNHFIVASRGPSPEVYIWDFSKHPSVPKQDSPFAPEGVCMGHSKEGYGMVWSPHTAGHLLTGSEDSTLCLWDINAAVAPSAAAGTQIKPTTVFKGHTDVVEDVDWHPKDPNMIASVGDDKTIRLWDSRSNPQKQSLQVVQKAHEGDINCFAFNPVVAHTFATGSADNTVAIWDTRNLKSRITSLVGHSDQVYMVDWAPHNESVLASCSADRRVGIWDLSRIGMEQTPEDAEDGPPELLFLHGGHTAKVSDFSWDVNDEWTMASVSEDNVLQVWNMAEEIYAAEDEEEQSSGEGEDQMLGEDELE